MESANKAQLTRRYIKAYLSLAGIFAAFVGVSEAQGAGWKPALAGMPLYVTLFIAITYRLVMDVLAIRKLERKRPSSADTESHDD
jgi:hypothetical protein